MSLPCVKIQTHSSKYFHYHVNILLLYLFYGQNNTIELCLQNFKSRFAQPILYIENVYRNANSLGQDLVACHEPPSLVYVV